MHIVNHRIDRDNENKIMGIDRMIKNNIFKFEIDINMCYDELILFHDSSIKQLDTTVKLDTVPYCELHDVDTFGQLVKYLFDLKSSNKLKNDLHIYLDIKGTHISTISVMIEKLKLLNKKKVIYSDKTNPDIYIYLQTFNYKFILDLKRYDINPKYKIGLITCGYTPFVPPNIDYIVVEKQYIEQYENYLYFLRHIDTADSILPIYAYTVNSKNEISDQIKYDVLAGIFTDYPERF